VAESDVWINAGFFLFKQEIFDYIQEGEDLVLEPFERLIGERQLLAYKYTGFWTAMDTFKDRERLEDLWSAGKAPWIMW
jgi:glucose-1-phosphate cytidylyltransferase